MVHNQDIKVHVNAESEFSSKKLRIANSFKWTWCKTFWDKTSLSGTSVFCWGCVVCVLHRHKAFWAAAFYFLSLVCLCIIWSGSMFMPRPWKGTTCFRGNCCKHGDTFVFLLSSANEITAAGVSRGEILHLMWRLVQVGDRWRNRLGFASVSQHFTWWTGAFCSQRTGDLC